MRTFFKRLERRLRAEAVEPWAPAIYPDVPDFATAGEADAVEYMLVLMEALTPVQADQACTAAVSILGSNGQLWWISREPHEEHDFEYQAARWRGGLALLFPVEDLAEAAEFMHRMDEHHPVDVPALLAAA